MNPMYKPLFLEPKYISKYSALIRTFSSTFHNESKLNETFLSFIENQDKQQFIMIIVDEEDNICLCGKVNYNFKFSKSNSYDLFIQDFVCNQNLNKPLPFEYLINQFCQKLEEFESRNQYNVHRRFILSNHFISSLHHVFIKNGFSPII